MHLSNSISSSINAVWKHVKDAIIHGQSRFIPHVTVSHHSPKWFDSNIHHKVKCIRILCWKVKATSTTYQLNKLASSESELQTLMETTKQTYEHRLIAHSLSNSKALFTYIKSLSANNSIPCSMFAANSDQPVSASLKIANSFNNYFHSILTKSDFVLPPMDQVPTPTNQLHTINITTEEVHHDISSLNNSKAYSCDNIEPH